MSSGAGAANNHGSSKKRVRTTTNTTTDAVSPHQRLRLNDTLFDSLGTRYCGDAEERWGSAGRLLLTQKAGTPY